MNSWRDISPVFVRTQIVIVFLYKWKLLLKSGHAKDNYGKVNSQGQGNQVHTISITENIFWITHTFKLMFIYIW